MRGDVRRALNRARLSHGDRDLTGGAAVRRWFLLPAVLLLLAFSIFPLLASLALALGDLEPGLGLAYEWRGLANFSGLLANPRYLTAAFNTGVYVVVSLLGQLCLGIGLAWMLYQRPPGRRFFQVVFLLPMMMAPVAVGYMWKLILQNRIGAVNYFLGLTGAAPVPWLTQRWSALGSISVVEVWQWTPFVFLFMYAAMLSLPSDPIEAAMVDGATAWQVFRHVIFPMVRPIALAVGVLRGVETLKIIDTVFVMTAGGPGNSTESITLYAYREGLRFFKLGNSAAIGYTLLVGVILLALPIVLSQKSEGETA